MRRAWPLAVVLALSVSTGCQLHKDSNNCVTDPGMTTGGSTVCAKAPPSQFNQLGQ